MTGLLYRVIYHQLVISSKLVIHSVTTSFILPTKLLRLSVLLYLMTSYVLMNWTGSAGTERIFLLNAKILLMSMSFLEQEHKHPQQLQPLLLLRQQPPQLQHQFHVVITCKSSTTPSKSSYKRSII